MFETMRFVGRVSNESLGARGRPWLVLGFALLFSTLPDCCLLGHHAHGLGMEALGVICRAQG
jgi:hypothetical protein